MVLGSLVDCINKRAESREPRAECVRRPDGSLRFPQLRRRAADAMGRAERARRERQSRRLSFRPRRPAGPATPSSPSFVRRLPRTAAGLLLAFAALLALPLQAQAQTVTNTAATGQPAITARRRSARC